jgi:hypothetical protein
MNCLIASLLMLTMAFAAIPYFLVSGTKARAASMDTTARITHAKIMAIQENLDPGMVQGARPYVHKTSNGKGKAVASRSGQVVRVKIVKGGEQLVSPASFEVRSKNKVKRGKLNET